MCCRKRAIGTHAKEKKYNLANGPGLEDFLADAVPEDVNPYKRIKGKRFVGHRKL